MPELNTITDALAFMNNDASAGYIATVDDDFDKDSLTIIGKQLFKHFGGASTTTLIDLTKPSNIKAFLKVAEQGETSEWVSMYFLPKHLAKYWDLQDHGGINGEAFIIDLLLMDRSIRSREAANAVCRRIQNEIYWIHIPCRD